MNTAAIEHHGYDTFCYPLNEDELSISVQTGTDVNRVVLLYNDPYLYTVRYGSVQGTVKRLELGNKKMMHDRIIWSTVVAPEFKRCRYYFEIHAGTETVFLLEDCICTAEEFSQREKPHTFIFPWMNSSDICTPPSWPETTVWYQLFPSRFCRGSKSAADPTLKQWGTAKQLVANKDRFGGNIAGIIERLDYLADLGITGLYLNPVNCAGSQHKYDTTDYLTIDPEFGTKDTMKQLTKEAHQRGMRVMLDGVFNHSGWNFFAWQDVLKNREKSKYADWYMIRDFSFPGERGTSAHDGKFYSFAFEDYMPKLNTNNPEVRAYLLHVCETWVGEYDIDALRLDVANEVSHTFCRELQQRMREMKHDFFIVGEIWHDALPWLRGDQFDSVTNYPLQGAILNFITRKTATARLFEYDVNRCLTMYYRQTEKVLLNQMDTHDTARLVTLAGSEDTALQALALMFAMPGSACIYYGTEILLEGGPDPDCRRCMPWKEIENGSYNASLSFMKTLIALRKEHPALRSDEITFSYSDSEPRVIRFVKTDTSTGEKIGAVFNFGTTPVPVINDKGQKAKDNVPETAVLLARNDSENVVACRGFALYSILQ